MQVEEIADNSPQTPQPAMPSTPAPHLVLANRFEIDSPSKNEDNKLREVWDYARSQSNTKDSQDVLWQVIHLEGLLGAPRLGESRLDRLYRYCKLKRQESQIQSELKNVAVGSSLRIG
jgi:hypothetical protein